MDKTDVGGSGGAGAKHQSGLPSPERLQRHASLLAVLRAQQYNVKAVQFLLFECFQYRRIVVFPQD